MFFIFGDIDSASDSASLMLQVIVIMGGTKGRSREVGLSKSFKVLRIVVVLLDFSNVGN